MYFPMFCCILSAFTMHTVSKVHILSKNSNSELDWFLWFLVNFCWFWDEKFNYDIRGFWTKYWLVKQCVQYDLISILFPMLMQHRLSGACFLFHGDVKLPRKDPLCLERKIPLRSKVFLKWRLFFPIYWWLSSGTYCLQSFWEHWYPIAWTHGQFPYSPSRIIYPFGLLSFYTPLYWLTRGQRQYKITLRNKSWIRFSDWVYIA